VPDLTGAGVWVGLHAFGCADVGCDPCARLRAYKEVHGEYGDELLLFLDGMVKAGDSALVAA
jgi:hypothetical protein